MAKPQTDLDALATAIVNCRVAIVERPFLVPVLGVFYLKSLSMAVSLIAL